MSTRRVYNHLGGRQLRHWHTVVIEDRPTGNDGELNKHVIFTSTIHVRKEVDISWCYASTFSDAEILADGQLSAKHAAMYGHDARHCSCCGH